MAHLDPRRNDDVTASDVPAICGENPFNCARGVLFKKVFRISSPDTVDTLRGRTNEPVAIKWFCEVTNATVEYPGYLKHAKYPWFGGTVDGIATMPDGRRVVIEVKCPRQIKDEIPLHYVGQVQSYMEICDIDMCLFIQSRAAGPRSPRRLKVRGVERDRGYMALRLPALWRFWERMQTFGTYANRVVLVIQRAWRMYIARRAFDQASRMRMISRLRCASTVGKIAGFLRRSRAIDRPEWPVVEFNELWVQYAPKTPPEAARPAKKRGCLYVMVPSPSTPL